MLVDKQLVIDAKEKLGSKAALTIAKDLELKEFDEINLKSLCFFHDEDTPSFIWNQNLNNFHCFGCQKNYDIIEHYMSFYKLTFLDAAQKLFEETDTEYSFGEKGVQIYKNYIYPFYDKNDNRKTVEDYLKIRKISKKTLDYCDVQQDNNHNIVFNFCDSNDVLTLVKYRPAKKIEHGETKSWCQENASTKNLLFNMNRIDVAKPLLIQEGEIDCLASIESGYTNCVSVPFGAGNIKWIEENFEWLEQFDKIIIWSDNDDPGMKMRKEVCSRLGMWRTFYVDLPQTLENKDGRAIRVKDTNEVLFFFGKEKVIDLIENAQDFPIDGVINLARVEPFDLEAAPGLYTGLKNVDNIIYKFLFGSVLMVTGRTGSGKSALISQLFICEPLNQGHDVFIYSGELGKDLIQSWLELSMAGPEKIKMRDRDIHVIDSQAIEEMHNWYDERVWLYEKNSNSSEDILERAVASIRKYGVKVILLDNLMSIDIDADSQSLNQKQKEFLNKLNQLALLYNVLVVLVAHPKKFQSGTDLSIDDISGASEMPNTAQYVIAVKRYWKKDKDGIKKQNGRGYVVPPTEYDGEITIKKNRYTGRVGKVDLFFDYPSYRFYNTPEELWKRYKWNNDKSPLPTHDPNKHSIMPEEME